VAEAGNGKDVYIIAYADNATCNLSAIGALVEMCQNIFCRIRRR